MAATYESNEAKIDALIDGLAKLKASAGVNWKTYVPIHDETYNLTNDLTLQLSADWLLVDFPTSTLMCPGKTLELSSVTYSQYVEVQRSGTVILKRGFQGRLRAYNYE